MHGSDSPTGDDRKDRYRCPHGHVSWERVNDHVWCHACARAVDHDDEVDPEYHELLDMTTGERVAFEELRASWPDFREVSAY
jgi:hypothetical protein